jgi:hypothetical protein
MNPIIKYINEQIEWSKKTFGEGKRTEGICKHIEKEVNEIRQSPLDILEWVDVIILALDGAWRAGYTSDEIWKAMEKKHHINFTRRYPKPSSQDEPVEHVREPQ